MKFYISRVRDDPQGIERKHRQIFAAEDAGSEGRREVRREVKRKKSEKKLVVWDKSMIYMTDEQRKNFEKEHPGYRLPFEIRHPYFPIWITVLAVLSVAVAVITRWIVMIPR